jgi:hypothetical protein
MQIVSEYLPWFVASGFLGVGLRLGQVGDTYGAVMILALLLALGFILILHDIDGDHVDWIDY